MVCPAGIAGAEPGLTSELSTQVRMVWADTEGLAHLLVGTPWPSLPHYSRGQGTVSVLFIAVFWNAAQAQNIANC